MSLTDTEVKRSRPRDKAYRLSDERGLYLQISTAGGKLWRWKYRFQGKEKLMPLGRYPDVPLAKAREDHSVARRLLATGTDPMALRKSEKAALKSNAKSSFQSIAYLWVEHWKVDKSERHAGTTLRRIETNILPHLGSRPIAEIKAPELLAMAKAIEARGVGDLAKRSLQTTGQVFRYAIAHGYVERNPCADFKPSDVLKPRKKVNMARIDAKDLPALLRAIEVYRGKVITRLAMKLLSLTFVRTSELIEARWDEIDLEALRWNIPPERMKMDSPHIVPLSSQAIEVLELLRPLSGSSELLFPGEQNRKKSMSNMTILMALKRMGYKGTMTGHGFRGLASTVLHEHGYAHDHIELQLAHVQRNAVSAAYNHALYLEARTAMMQDWADFLERTQRGGRVFSFLER